MSEKDCFVIAPIGDTDSDTRTRSDIILEHIITPAVEEFGYKATRADQICEPGLITSQVIQRIVDAPLVIADLTEHNANVFYELAVRHAIKKPLIQLMQVGEQIPFDISGTRIIQVDHCDLRLASKAKKEIVNQIKSLQDKPTDFDTPISVSLDLQQLRQSDNLVQKALADVFSAVTDLRSTVLGMEIRLNRSPIWSTDNTELRMRDVRTDYLLDKIKNIIATFPDLIAEDKINNEFSSTEYAKKIEKIHHILEVLDHDRR